MHGVERWRSNCSDGIDPQASHRWRRPLRAALNWLARELDARFEDRTAALSDIGRLRDAYGAVAAGPYDERASFVASLVGTAEVENVLTLLEGLRARLGMFGSCAWFFDDVTGHETELMLRLAAFAIGEIAGDESALETEFIERLALAKSGATTGGDAAAVYRDRVLPLRSRAVV